MGLLYKAKAICTIFAADDSDVDHCCCTHNHIHAIQLWQTDSSKWANVARVFESVCISCISLCPIPSVYIYSYI